MASTAFSFGAHTVTSVLLDGDGPTTVKADTECFAFLTLFILFLFGVMVLFLDNGALGLLCGFTVTMLKYFAPVE